MSNYLRLGVAYFSYTNFCIKYKSETEIFFRRVQGLDYFHLPANSLSVLIGLWRSEGEFHKNKD